MSRWGDEMTALIAIVRTAVGATLTAANSERDFRPGELLAASELPHLFIFNPRSTDTELPFLQTEVRTSYQAELWVDATQEALCVFRDSIRDGIDADQTLTATVRRCRLTSDAIFEDSGAVGRKVLALEFETMRLEA